MSYVLLSLMTMWVILREPAVDLPEGHGLCADDLALVERFARFSNSDISKMSFKDWQAMDRRLQALVDHDLRLENLNQNWRAGLFGIGQCAQFKRAGTRLKKIGGQLAYAEPSQVTQIDWSFMSTRWRPLFFELLVQKQQEFAQKTRFSPDLEKAMALGRYSPDWVEIHAVPHSFARALNDAERAEWLQWSENFDPVQVRTSILNTFKRDNQLAFVFLDRMRFLSHPIIRAAIQEDPKIQTYFDGLRSQQLQWSSIDIPQTIPRRAQRLLNFFLDDLMYRIANSISASTEALVVDPLDQPSGEYRIITKDFHFTVRRQKAGQVSQVEFKFPNARGLEDYLRPRLRLLEKANKRLRAPVPPIEPPVNAHLPTPAPVYLAPLGLGKMEAPVRIVLNRIFREFPTEREFLEEFVAPMVALYPEVFRNGFVDRFEKNLRGLLKKNGSTSIGQKQIEVASWIASRIDDSKPTSDSALVPAPEFSIEYPEEIGPDAPAEVAVSEVEKLLENSGWSWRHANSGSHRVFTHPDALRPVVIEYHGTKIPRIYARNVWKQAQISLGALTE